MSRCRRRPSIVGPGPGLGIRARPATEGGFGGPGPLPAETAETDHLRRTGRRARGRLGCGALSEPAEGLGLATRPCASGAMMPGLGR